MGPYLVMRMRTHTSFHAISLLFVFSGTRYREKRAFEGVHENDGSGKLGALDGLVHQMSAVLGNQCCGYYYYHQGGSKPIGLSSPFVPRNYPSVLM